MRGQGPRRPALVWEIAAAQILAPSPSGEGRGEGPGPTAACSPCMGNRCGFLPAAGPLGEAWDSCQVLPSPPLTPALSRGRGSRFLLTLRLVGEKWVQRNNRAASDPGFPFKAHFSSAQGRGEGPGRRRPATLAKPIFIPSACRGVSTNSSRHPRWFTLISLWNWSPDARDITCNQADRPSTKRPFD